MLKTIGYRIGQGKSRVCVLTDVFFKIYFTNQILGQHSHSLCACNHISICIIIFLSAQSLELLFTWVQEEVGGGGALAPPQVCPLCELPPQLDNPPSHKFLGRPTGTTCRPTCKETAGLTLVIVKISVKLHHFHYILKYFTGEVADPSRRA